MSTDPQNPDKALLDRLESRLGGEQPAAAPNADPLSELARLIGDASGGQPPAPQAPPAPQQQQPYPDPSGFPPAAQPYPGDAQPAPQADFPEPGMQPPAQPAPQPAAQPASSLESDIAAQLAQSLQSMDFGSAAPGFSQPAERQGFALDPQQPVPPAQPAPQPVPPPANPELADLYGHQQPLNLRQPQAAPPAAAPPAAAQPAAAPSQAGTPAFPGQPPVAGNAVHFDAAAPNFQPVPGADVGFEGAAAQQGYAEQGFAPAGGEQGYMAGQAGDEFSDAFADYDAEPEPGKSRRGMLVVGTVLALVVVGAASVFGYRAIVGGGERVPTIRAADGDSRALPQAEQPAGDQNKLVYERISGTAADGQAQLVPREESPAVAPADRQIRVVTGGQSTAQDGDATRTVRTFSVSPDGQIVRNPEPEPAPEPETTIAAAPPAPPAPPESPPIQPAPVQQAPAAVPQPQPSQVATQVTAQPPQVQPAPVAAPQPQPQTGPVVLNQQAGVAAPAVAPAPVIVQPQPTVQPPAIAPVVNPLAQQRQTRRFTRSGGNNDDPLAETLGQSAQVPQQRVATAPQPQTITLPPAQVPQAGQVLPQAVAPQAAAPQPVAPQPAPQQQQGVSLPFGAAATQPAASGGSVVQIASSRSEGDARAAISRAQQRFGAIIGNYQSSVARSDLGTRGIFYRASFGPMSRAEATDVCNRLKARGGDCFVRASGG